MSASEKLRTLEQNFATFHAPLAVKKVMDSFPQLLAVVEGQESLISFVDQWAVHPDREEALLQIISAACERRFALAALDEALT